MNVDFDAIKPFLDRVTSALSLINGSAIGSPRTPQSPIQTKSLAPWIESMIDIPERRNDAHELAISHVWGDEILDTHWCPDWTSKVFGDRMTVTCGGNICTMPNNRLNQDKVSLIVNLIEKMGRDTIWWDTVDISQNNPKVKSQQIYHLPAVYKEAKLTLVIHTCSTMIKYLAKNSTSIDPEDLEKHLANSRWRTRAWTYQEEVLSRARLHIAVWNGAAHWVLDTRNMESSVANGVMAAFKRHAKYWRDHYFSVAPYIDTPNKLDYDCDPSLVLDSLRRLYWECAELPIAHWGTEGKYIGRGVQSSSGCCWWPAPTARALENEELQQDEWSDFIKVISDGGMRYATILGRPDYLSLMPDGLHISGRLAEIVEVSEIPSDRKQWLGYAGAEWGINWTKVDMYDASWYKPLKAYKIKTASSPNVIVVGDKDLPVEAIVHKRRDGREIVLVTSVLSDGRRVPILEAEYMYQIGLTKVLNIHSQLMLN
jgi:hypothetical protein